MISIRAILDKFMMINSVIMPTGNLGVMRGQMPQIDSQHQSAFIAWLLTQGFDSKRMKMPVSALMLAQNEINKSKVFKLMQIYRDGGNCPALIVSSDGFVIDGSHRFVAWLNIDKYSSIDVIRVDMPAMALIQLCQRFPRTKYRNHSDANVSK